MCSTVVFGGGAGVRGANVGSRDVNWRAWLTDDSRLQSPQRCWSYVASIQLTHCQDSVLLQPAAVAVANNMSVVSTFAKVTFSTAGIRKPHAAQPDLLLVLLWDLSPPLCGRTEMPCDDAHADGSSGVA